MKEKQLLKRQVKALERFGNDDFQLICLEGGTAAYATSELHFLLRQRQLDARRLAYYRVKLQFLATLLPVFLVLALGCCWLAYFVLTYFLLALSAFWALLLLITYWRVQQTEQRIQNTERANLLIKAELVRRRTDTEIY